MQPERSAIAFSHIPKTGGLTLERILRQNFGIRHLSVIHSNSGLRGAYTLADFQRDLRVYPWVQSMSGHSLKIHADLDEGDYRLRWYTVLRDPVKRYLSLYQHQYSRGQQQYRLPFREWMETYGRRNQMVRWIAGSEDLEAAKQLILERFEFVGITEQYDASLLLLKRSLDLPFLNIGYGQPINRAPSDSVRQRVLEDFETYRPAVEERNDLDQRLYEFVLDRVWPDQLERYGGEDLEACARSEVTARVDTRCRLRHLQNRMYRNLIYKPIARISKARVVT